MIFEKSCRNKTTGEISTIVNTFVGFSCGVCIIGKDGEKKEIELEKFKKDYEVISVDITPVIPALQSYLEVCPQAKNIFFSLMRKIHPGGYFHVGDLVYITYDGASWAFGIVSRDTHLLQFGPSNPYIITKISENDLRIHRYISKMPDPEQYENIPGELVLPISIDIEVISGRDVYSLLSRYDTEY